MADPKILCLVQYTVPAPWYVDSEGVGPCAAVLFVLGAGKIMTLCEIQLLLHVWNMSIAENYDLRSSIFGLPCSH